LPGDASRREYVVPRKDQKKNGGPSSGQKNEEAGRDTASFFRKIEGGEPGKKNLCD